MESGAFDPESYLQRRLNEFLCTEFRLPAADYYSKLELDGFLRLKSVLGDINNILTLRVSLAFSDWVSNSLSLSVDSIARIRSDVLTTKPNANGFDIEIADPIKVIAEIKCNIPINAGTVYGSAQRDGIAKDIASLVEGKSKSPMVPSECLKFMVFLDKPEVRAATAHFIKNMKAHRDRIVIVEGDTKTEALGNVYITFVEF